MTAPSAWRPLKDAPKNLPAYVETSNGTHVAQWDGEWLYWPDEHPRTLSEDTPSLPIADTYELDRAVQSEIARAFGELICRLGDEADCANFRHWGALAAFRDILHTCMSGRIPDEVP